MGLVRLEAAQKVGHAVIGGQSLVHVGVAVGGADQGAAQAVQHAEGPVGPAAHAYLLPQVSHAQIAQNHAGRAVVDITLVIDVGGFAHVVDLGRGQEGLGHGQVAHGPGFVVRAFRAVGRQLGQQGAGPVLGQGQSPGFGRAVKDRAGSGHDQGPQFLQIGQQGLRLRFQLFQQAAY